MKLSFVLRDPIDRHISGFQSRLRMGRPIYNRPWRAGEAISFAFFSRPLDFLRALVSDDERMKSAAQFAYANIRHQAWNYVYYFKSVEYLKEVEGSIGVVGRIERMDDFLRAMCRVSGADEGLVETLSARVHESAVPSASLAAELSADERAAIRDALRAEYEIYDHLCALADREPPV